jgi:hypothetical protein
MQCTIAWKQYDRADWQSLLHKCPHSTILQSYYYAQAMREIKQQGIRQGVILIEGQPAGCVQIQEVSLFGKMIHGVSLDRGPLWFDGYGKPAHWNAFLECFNDSFPDRLGRKRRLMPEYFGRNHSISMDSYKKNTKERDYKTILVNLSYDLDDIRKNLKKNWRNMLTKSEKQDLVVEVDETLSTLSHFLKIYTQDRFQKGYAGTSAKFLAALAKYAVRGNDCLLLNAREDNEIIASVMVFSHGQGATYQAGWTTPYGRDKSAHHLLLWQAIEILKDRGVMELDLGGLPVDNDGLKQFKQGLGGQEIALIGSYH